MNISVNNSSLRGKSKTSRHSYSYLAFSSRFSTLRYLRNRRTIHQLATLTWRILNAPLKIAGISQSGPVQVQTSENCDRVVFHGWLIVSHGWLGRPTWLTGLSPWLTGSSPMADSWLGRQWLTGSSPMAAWLVSQRRPQWVGGPSGRASVVAWCRCCCPPGSGCLCLAICRLHSAVTATVGRSVIGAASGPTKAVQPLGRVASRVSRPVGAAANPERWCIRARLACRVGCMDGCWDWWCQSGSEQIFWPIRFSASQSVKFRILTVSNSNDSLLIFWVTTYFIQFIYQVINA